MLFFDLINPLRFLGTLLSSNILSEKVLQQYSGCPLVLDFFVFLYIYIEVINVYWLYNLSYPQPMRL
jgi:hypothetical protein